MATLAVIWRSAGLLLATDAASVIEVLPPVAGSPVPGAPAWIRGMFVHRGNLVPLVDAERMILGVGMDPNHAPMNEPPAHTNLMHNRVLVVRLHAKGDAPEWRVGLWVESILELERVEFGGAGTHAGICMDATRFLGPIAQTRFGLVQLVKTNELFTPEQLAMLTRHASEVVA